MSSIPDEVRHSFSFDPTLLSGGSQAVEKDEQAYADADEYMKINPEEDEDLGSSSLSKELKQMVRTTTDTQRRKRLCNASVKKHALTCTLHFDF